MIIEGERFTFEDTFDTPITVGDSWVMPKNKLGDGNGEAKLYFGSRDKMGLHCNVFRSSSGLAGIYASHQSRIFHTFTKLSWP